jgi:hypothetical protein
LKTPTIRNQGKQLHPATDSSADDSSSADDFDTTGFQPEQPTIQLSYISDKTYIIPSGADLFLLPADLGK